MIYQLVLLLCLFSVNCATSDNKNIILKQHKKAIIDSVKVINEIRKQYTEVNVNVASYRKVEKDILGQSTENGIIIVYYDKEELKKIIITYYGEIGKSISEYYFNQDGLFFVIKCDYFYNKPIYVKGSRVALVEKNRYYFYKQTLFKWLDKNKKNVRPDTKEYQLEGNYFIDNVEKFKKILNYKPYQ